MERRDDIKKDDNINIEDEFKEIVSKTQQILSNENSVLNRNLQNSKDAKATEDSDKNDDSSSSGSSSTSSNNSSNGSDSDDTPNFRDKDKELKEFVKDQLSLEAQDVINMNEDEFNQIIEQLRRKGLSKEGGIQLQRLRNVKKGIEGILR